MTARTPVKWTVVQHSAWGYGRNGEFAHGLETKPVTTKIMQEGILKAGGVLFDDYNEAEDWAHREMYPEHVTGLIPQAPGRFADKHIQGLALYIPRERTHS